MAEIKMTTDLERELLSTRLDNIRNKLTNNLNRCGKPCAIYICEGCGYEKVVSYFCGIRVCKKCTGIRWLRLWGRYEGILEYFSNSKFMSLTIQGHHKLTRDLKRGFDSNVRNFFRILYRKDLGIIKPIYKNKGIPGVRSFEVKKKSDGFYCHYHCLVDVKYIDGDLLNKIWQKVTKTSKWVDIRKIDSTNPVDALKYVLKYAVKPLAFFDLDFYIEVLYRTRMLTKMGGLYGIKFPAVKNPLTCPNCGSPMRYYQPYETVMDLELGKGT